MNEEEYKEANRLLDLIYNNGYGKDYAVETLLILITKETEQSKDVIGDMINEAYLKERRTMRRKDHQGIYTELINIRVTPDQKKFLVKMAKKYKQPLSAYLRDWLFMDMS